MGVWGTGIYANDMAADLKDLFQDVVRLPVPPDELLRILANAFGQVKEEVDGNFYLALDDLFHTYGIDSPAVREIALDLISSGKDLDSNRELGMTEPNLRRRAAVLKALAEKLAHPSPNPRNRKMLAGPEEWLFEEGDYAVFPTCKNDAMNPYMPKRLMQDWEQDDSGGFVVLGRTRQLNFFAVYLIGVLQSPGTTGFVEMVTLSPQHFRRMQVKVVERLPLIDGAVDAAFPAGHPIYTYRPQILANAILLLHAPVWGGFDNRVDFRNFVATAIPSPSDTQSAPPDRPK
jgi:hypothetical protein